MSATNKITALMSSLVLMLTLLMFSACSSSREVEAEDEVSAQPLVSCVDGQDPAVHNCYAQVTPRGDMGSTLPVTTDMGTTNPTDMGSPNRPLNNRNRPVTPNPNPVTPPNTMPNPAPSPTPAPVTP